jgi:hypothetical protein
VWLMRRRRRRRVVSIIDESERRRRRGRRREGVRMICDEDEQPLQQAAFEKHLTSRRVLISDE